MKKKEKFLDKDWFIKPAIDFELKKYQLLDYLQYVSLKLEQLKLFPIFNDLHKHIKHLNDFISSLERLELAFPKSISQLDFNNCTITYKPIHYSSEQLQITTDIVQYALDQISVLLKKAEELKRKLIAAITIEPLGLLSTENTIGYLFIEQPATVSVYSYEISTLYQSSTIGYNPIVYVGEAQTYSVRIGHTVSDIKREIIKQKKDLSPYPCFYLISSTVHAPIKESILPLTCDLLIAKA